MTPADLAIGVGVMAIWGFNLAVAKTGMEVFPPLFLTALRFAVLALLLGPFVKPPRGRWLPVLGIGLVLGYFHFALMFSGLFKVDAAIAAIAIQLQVPFAVLLAALFLGDKIGWRRGLGTLVAFLGVAVVVGSPQGASDPLHLGMVIAAAGLWAIANLLIKRLQGVDPAVLNAWVAIVAAPLLLATSFALEEGQWQAATTADWRGWFAVLYQSLLVFGFGYWTWYKLLARYPVSLTMPFTLLMPIFGVISGILFLGEPLTFNLIVGSVLTLVGIGILVIRRPASAGTAARS